MTWSRGQGSAAVQTDKFSTDSTCNNCSTHTSCSARNWWLDPVLFTIILKISNPVLNRSKQKIQHKKNSKRNACDDRHQPTNIATNLPWGALEKMPRSWLYPWRIQQPKRHGRPFLVDCPKSKHFEYIQHARMYTMTKSICSGTESCSPRGTCHPPGIYDPILDPTPPSETIYGDSHTRRKHVHAT